jgi:hypothetical protein
MPQTSSDAIPDTDRKFERSTASGTCMRTTGPGNMEGCMASDEFFYRRHKAECDAKSHRHRDAECEKEDPYSMVHGRERTSRSRSVKL